MNLIVFDLEWNIGYQPKTFFYHGTELTLRGEIIQIGAARINDRGDVLDTFEVNLKPHIFRKLQHHIAKVTGLSQGDLDAGLPMKEGLQKFLDWAGDDAELAEWGLDDVPVLKQNLFLVGLDENWPNRWYDLQRIFLQAYPRKEGEGLTLESVVDRLGIPKEEPFHNALDDALYTARVCRKLPLAEGLATYPTEEELLTEALLGAENTGRDVQLFMNRMEHDDYRSVPELYQARCPECGAPLQNDEVWLKRGNTGYYTEAICPDHGPWFLRFKLNRRDPSSVSAGHLPRNRGRLFLFSVLPLLTNPAFCLMIDENVTQFLQNCKYSNKRYKMDTERWQILLKAIDRGSLRAAAEEMGFTVSGISRSVATLEKELGFALLHRAKSGVQPTAECRQLLPSVRELLFAQERLEQTAAKVRGADCGTIVIGTAYNCYYEWVTRMMAAFRTRHPGVVIKIVNGTSSELAEMLLDHRTDFCLISHRDSLPVWLPIRQDELMVLLPKNHPLADRESFPVESLKTEPFIDSYPGMETDITLIFDKLKARPDARYSTMDITATYAMVSAGLGIRVNNAINHQDGYPGVVERPMNPHQMMEIGLACGENLAPAAQAFLDFVKERLPE